MATPVTELGDSRWNLMFHLLKREDSQPSEVLSASRGWLKSTITMILSRDLDELKSTFPPAKDVIARMIEIGRLQSISLGPAYGGKTPQI